MYRTTPHATTGECPSVLLNGRKLRTRLDLMMPSVEQYVQRGQQKIMDRTAKDSCREFQIGDKVSARNFGLGSKWKDGVVQEVLGSQHYRVNMGEDSWKRHIDQLIGSSVPNSLLKDNQNPVEVPVVVPNIPGMSVSVNNPSHVPVNDPSPMVTQTKSDTSVSKQAPGPVRVSSRVKNVPGHLKDFVLK